MSLESKIKKRNKGLRTVRAGTAAVAVGGIACSGVIAAALAAQSGAFDVEVLESATVTPTVVPEVVSIRSVVGVDKAKKKPKPKPVVQPKPAPTPPAPAPAPQPNNNNNNNSNSKPAKSNGS